VPPAGFLPVWQPFCTNKDAAGAPKEITYMLRPRKLFIMWFCFLGWSLCGSPIAGAAREKEELRQENATSGAAILWTGTLLNLA